MNRKVVLHIGFGKVGSSSLQRFLSQVEIEKSSKYIYCVIDGKSKLIHGESLRTRAKQSSFGYQSSSVFFMKDNRLDELKSSFDSLFVEGLTPIISCEGWVNIPQLFADFKVFEKLDITVEVLVFVRPQVSWLNSAWWQWIAWNDAYLSISDYYNKNGFQECDWYSRIEDWKEMERVISVNCRVQTKDVVKDFKDCYDLNGIMSEDERHNISSSSLVLKVLWNNRDLRGIHDSKVDFKLAQVIKDEKSTPWVLDNSLIKKVINDQKLANQKLMNNMICSEHVELMENNLDWWSEESFNHKVFTDLNEFGLTNGEKDLIIRSFIKNIV